MAKVGTVPEIFLYVFLYVFGVAGLGETLFIYSSSPYLNHHDSRGIGTKPLTESLVQNVPEQSEQLQFAIFQRTTVFHSSQLIKKLIPGSVR